MQQLHPYTTFDPCLSSFPAYFEPRTVQKKFATAIKDDTRTEDAAVAAPSAPSTTRLPSRPECTVSVVTSSTSGPSTLGPSMLNSSTLGSSTWDGMIKRGGGAMRGSGRPRGRGGYPRSSRGTYGQAPGSYGQASSSSYAFSQSRQQNHDRNSSWDSKPDEQRMLPAYHQQTGRGRGGHHYNQQTATRRSYRGAGKSRGFWSRPRTYQPRLSYDQQQQQQDGQINTDWDRDRLSLTSYTDHDAGTAAVSLPQAQAGNIVPQRTDSRTPVRTPMMLLANTDGHLSPTMLDDVVSLSSTIVEPQTPAVSFTPWPLNPVDLESTPPLVSDSFGDESTPSGHHQQRSSGDSVSTSPTTSLHHQDLRFQGVFDSLNHPSHVPEMIYAWYPFPIVPGEGAGTPPLPVDSFMPYATVPALHALPPRPPPDLYFTHDHAFLALCPPGPFVPITWWPIPYLQYWGPERFGEDPNFYDVPMVSYTACSITRRDVES